MSKSLIILLSCFCLLSCDRPQPKPKVTRLQGNAMTIDYKITIGKELSRDEKEHVQKIIQTTFQEIDALYNKYNPHSELSKLNALKAHQVEKLSPQLEKLFQLTNYVVILTENRFDPTIEPIQQLWKTRLEAQRLPTQAEISALQPAIGWHHIHIANCRFHKDHDLTALDLGGIAKGYAVDQIVERLNETGYADVFVDWGGEIRTSGQHPEGRPWKIFISQFEDSSRALAYVTLENEAIATSGDYLQNWEVNGTSYYHVFDVKKLQPYQKQPNKIASASVKTARCALADGLATCGLTFDTLAEAEAWAKRVNAVQADAQFWFFSREGN